MKARLWLLILIAGAMAVWVAVKPPSKPHEDLGPTFDPDSVESMEQIRLTQKMLWERPLAGEDPPEKPELEISVEVDTSTGKNRLVFFITETHGYYVETFEILVWHTGGADIYPNESKLEITHRANRFLEANGTLKECIEVVPAELANIGGSIGETGQWDAEVVYFNRAREKSPNPLPPLADVPRCR